MEITITVPPTAPRGVALSRAMNAYNARNVPLNEQQFLQKLVDAQLDGLVASYLKTKVRPVEFLQRFTQEERTAIRGAAKTSPAIEDYLQMLAAVGNGELDLTHELTTAGVQALESAGLIAAGRAAQILAL